MKKYYLCSNNGVRALVSEEVYLDIEKYNNIWRYFSEADKEFTDYENRWRAELSGRAVYHLMGPIFTFVHEDRFGKYPWFTGIVEDYALIAQKLESRGDIIEEGGFYVPFSNAAEIGLHGKDAMKSELSHTTTRAQFRETFGFSLEELRPNPPQVTNLKRHITTHHTK